jgi:hypothetical protein
MSTTRTVKSKKKIPVKLIIPVELVDTKPWLLKLQDYLEFKLQSFFEPKRKFFIHTAWPIWAKTLGPKISEESSVSDAAALIRTVWVIVHLATCAAIITNVFRHW